MRRCLDCSTSLPTGSHFNTKRCEACKKAVLKRPRSSMTNGQIKRAKGLIGKMPREEIAKEMGVSLSNLKRAFRGTRLVYFNKYVANPSLVQKVAKYYEKHGLKETQVRFPDVRVRSVVERYKLYSPRQRRWSSQEIIKAAQMAGLVSHERQAQFFSRPGANAGSIKSLWTKRFGLGGGSVNGLSWSIAKHFVREACPSVETEFWATRQKRKCGRIEYSRKLVTWKDFSRYQKNENPDWLKEAAKTMARFQMWLHGTRNVRSRVQKISKAGGV